MSFSCPCRPAKQSATAPRRAIFSTPMLLLLMSLLLSQQHVHGYPGMVKKPDTDARPRLYRAKEIVSISKELRAGDYRLVRPSPSDETQVEQHRWCPYKLRSFVMTLCTSTVKGRATSRGKMSVSLHKRGVAAEAVALCLTNQPQFRDLAADTTWMTTELSDIQQSQLVGTSLAAGLTVLLQDGLRHYQQYHQDGSAVLAMAQAAEAVWIASFHHAAQIQDFLEHDTIAVLGEIIVSLRPPQFDSLQHPYQPAHAVMWACAALQNLAANYCDNELGYCIWEWQEQQNDTPVLGLDEDTAVLVRPDLAQRARQQMAAIPHLLETLTDWICHVGPVHSKPNATYGWPGEAQLWKDLTFNAPSPQLQSPSIVPWAAAGVVKNLLLGKDDLELQHKLQSSSSLAQCLCRMKDYSPDWLEHGKAAAAVYFWGPQQDRICGPGIYETCRDDEHWEHGETGETCKDYTRERWCIEHGDELNAHGNKTANQACCLCGGGEQHDNDNQREDGNSEETVDNSESEEEQQTSEGDNRDDVMMIEAVDIGAKEHTIQGEL